MLLKRLRIVLWLAVGLAVLGGGVLLTSSFFRSQATQLGSSVSLTAPFRLVDQNGQPVTEQNFRNRPTAWFFGFTHCPDVCPTMLFQMSEHLKSLGSDADKLNVVFVTVDPERDTPEILKEYVSAFDPRIVALTGRLDAIQAMTKGFFVHFAKVPQKDGSYSMDHTSMVLLSGRDSVFKGTLDMHEPIETQLQKLVRLVRET